MGMNLYNSEIYQQDIESAWKLGNFNKLEGSRILITGATGMIASVIIDILMHYNNIIILPGVSISLLSAVMRKRLGSVLLPIGIVTFSPTFPMIYHNLYRS